MNLLAIDIGSEYIKTVIAKIEESNLNIVGAAKIKHGPEQSPQSIASICEKSIVVAENQAKENANAVVIGISDTLTKGNTAAVHYTRKTPDKPITENEISEIIKKVQQKSGEIAQKTIALETGNKNIEVRLINSAISSLEIDGYKADSPIGLKGTDLTIQFYTAFAPLIQVAAIEKLCNELNLDLLTIAIKPFATCRACLGNNLNSTFSAIVIDLDARTTNLAIINDGGVIGTETFNIGTAKGTNNPKAWLTGIEVSVNDINTQTVLPTKIFLCGDGAESEEIQTAIATSDWYKNLHFNHRPIVDIIDVATLPNISIQPNTTIDSSFITAIGLLHVGTDSLSGSLEKHNLKTKISKLLQK